MSCNDLEKLLERVGLGNLVSSFMDEKLDCRTGLSGLESIPLEIEPVWGRDVQIKQLLQPRNMEIRIVLTKLLNRVADVQYERTLLFSPSNSKWRFGAETQCLKTSLHSSMPCKPICCKSTNSSDLDLDLEDNEQNSQLDSHSWNTVEDLSYYIVLLIAGSYMFFTAPCQLKT